MGKRQRERTRVLALHAAGATSALWDDVAMADPALEILAPDLAALLHAVGGRPGPLVRALAGVVPRGRVVLAGCEIGANVALEVAALLGDRCAGVLLLNPQPVRPEAIYRERTRHMSRLLRTDMSIEELTAWVPLVVNRSARPRGEAAARSAEAMFREAGSGGAAALLQLAADFPDGTLALRLVRAQVLALFGAESLNPFPGPNWIPDWRKALGVSAVELLAGCRQWLPLEAPERVAKAIAALASGACGAAPSSRRASRVG